MPNRIIKESTCTSDSVDLLTWFEEVFFYRLIVNCDDYGRMDARPAILKARLFPLKKNITETQIGEVLNKLATVGIALVYEYDHKPYLQLLTWNSHQRIRNHKSKYPAPDMLRTIDGQLTDNCARNPIQSESESESNTNICAEQNAPCPAAASPIITLELNDNSEYPVFVEQTEEWAGLYPAVDVIQQLRNMKGWLMANPKKRKTKAGIKRFINNWLSREQDKGGGNSGNNRADNRQNSSDTGGFGLYL